MTELLRGGCTCGRVRYEAMGLPMFVNCCHCRWCQRESGTAFALNAMYERDRLRMTQGALEHVPIPTLSGSGQRVFRCGTCKIAIYSNYAGAGELVRFLRVGTLDEPDRLPPNVHIFVDSKQPWLALPPEAPAFAAYYDRETVWPAASLERRRALLSTDGADTPP